MSKQNEGKKEYSAKFLRQRKFFMVLPLITLPFVVLLAWTIGIVGEAKGSSMSEQAFQGLNLNLPGAAPSKDSTWNKMQYYIQADKDSAKIRSLLKNDPYRNNTEAIDHDAALEERRHKGYRYSFGSQPAVDQTEDAEEKVFKKLAELDKQLNAAQQPKVVKSLPTTTITTGVSSGEIDRLERMMQTVQQDKLPGQDGEMSELKEMLNTILDIQHPERVEEKLRKNSEMNTRKVFTVQKKEDDFISLLESVPDFTANLSELMSDSIPASIKMHLESNRFYGMEEEMLEQDQQQAVSAIVHEDQSLVSGGIVKLRILEELYIAGIRIPKDHFVYGTASLSGERLQLVVNSIHYAQHILPVSLSVYDLDGMPGIHIPGAITRDAAKRAASQSMQGLGSMNTLNPSIGSQITGAGMQLVQNIATKGVKLVRVQLKAGYPVLLKDSGK